MGWLSTAGLILKAIMLVFQYMRDQQIAGKAKAEALTELMEKLDARIDDSAAARAAPHSSEVPDPYDRANRKD